MGEKYKNPSLENDSSLSLHNGFIHNSSLTNCGHFHWTVTNCFPPPYCHWSGLGQNDDT